MKLERQAHGFIRGLMTSSRMFSNRPCMQDPSVNGRQGVMMVSHQSAGASLNGKIAIQGRCRGSATH